MSLSSRSRSRHSSRLWVSPSFSGGSDVDAENLIALILAVVLGGYTLYALFRAEEM